MLYNADKHSQASAVISPVTISIVTYNSAAVIDNCLSSIPDKFPVIVADNASSDNTISIISKNHPCVTIIKNNENIGFGCGHNKILSQVKTPFMFILNPDTELKKDCIENLLDVAKQFPDAAILSPKLLDLNGNAKHSFNRSLFNRNIFSSTVSKQLAEAPVCAEFLSGAALFVRTEIFHNIGGFDPNIFLFYEDDDLCIKTMQASYSCIFVPNAKLLHISGGSSPVNSWSAIYLRYSNMAWSELYLYKKYKSNAVYRFKVLKNTLLYLGKIISYIILLNRVKFQKYLARLFGTLTFIRGHKLN